MSYSTRHFTRGHLEQGRAGSRLPQPCHPQEKGTARSSHTYTSKSDADHSSWRICSCVGTDRDDKGRQLQHTSLTLGKAMIALRIKGRQSLCRQSALPRPIQGETINAGGDYWPSHSQPSSGKLAILQGQIIQAPKRGRQSVPLVGINGSHSRRGKGVGWVAFPPPHITVCFFSHR